MDILINTAAVSTTADQIDRINKKIREELTEIDSAIRILQQGWEGEASKSCVNKYEYIKRNFSDARFSVVNNLVSLMKFQAGEGYERTEQAAITAASAFK